MIEPTEVLIVGLGGIGSRLYREVALMLAYTYPAARLILMDHDRYEPGNRNRQLYEREGNKAEVCAGELARLFPGLRVVETVTEKLAADNVYRYIREGSIVLLAPDNNWARRIASERCEELEKVCLIAGGNSENEGQVQIYVRKDGKNVTNPLHHFLHPEIRDAEEPIAQTDAGCMALAPGQPQRAVTNNLVAANMLAALDTYLAGGNMPAIMYVDVRQLRTLPEFREVSEV